MSLAAIKRWLTAAATVSPDQWVPWCAVRGLQLRVVRQPAGFVVESGETAVPWRLEWGPAQRPFIPGHELRLRAELAVHSPLQAMVLDRPLQQLLERQVFEQYVGDVQTRVDADMPPEMRWLVMLNRLPGASLKGLRSRFCVFASHTPWAERWLAGRFGDQLARLPDLAGRPMVLSVSRQRLSLRTALERPDPEAVQPWIDVVEAALAQALIADESPTP